MLPDIGVIYSILTAWAKNGGPQTYMRLSEEYRERTGEWHEPHGSWDKPLGEINIRLAENGAPAISALVILKNKNEPGGNFWGCAKNVPLKPKNDSDRISKWISIVKEVRNYDWPKSIYSK